MERLMATKGLLVGFVLWLLLGGAAKAQDFYSSMSPMYRAAYATCLLLGHRGPEGHQQLIEASCVIVHVNDETGEATVLTAAHCWEEGYEYQIWPQGHTQATPAKFTWVSPSIDNCDLAIMKFTPTQKVCSVDGICAQTPARGSRVMLMGYPGGKRTLRGLPGVVKASEFDWVTVTAVAVPGDSGGAIVDMRGYLVGIVSATNFREGLGTNSETMRATVYGNQQGER